jgi:hypothetical protein
MSHKNKARTKVGDMRNTSQLGLISKYYPDLPPVDYFDDEPKHKRKPRPITLPRVKWMEKGK